MSKMYVYDEFGKKTGLVCVYAETEEEAKALMKSKYPFTYEFIKDIILKEVKKPEAFIIYNVEIKHE